QKKLVNFIPSKVENELFMPPEIREMLISGMQKVVSSKRGSARPGSMRTYYGHPHMLGDYDGLYEQIIGKTSTSEIVEAVDLDLEMGAYRYKHIWFTGVSYDPKEQPASGSKLEVPELVVIVYLRFGGYGKEAAPLVGQIIKKWREIKQKHAQSEA
ncbi:MAG: cell division protein FtsI/penicillin-binding protein 2, partial [Halioglobus sp.]